MICVRKEIVLDVVDGWKKHERLLPGFGFHLAFLVKGIDIQLHLCKREFFMFTDI